MVRLGAGGLDGRSLTAMAMTAALQALTKFSRLAASHKVDEILATATSATREADNGGDFIAEIERQTGIRVRVISGTEEARLIHLAAGYGVDIGGTHGGGHRHRRRQRRGHARHRNASHAGAEFQARRHPSHRAVRPQRPAIEPRRAASREAHQQDSGRLPGRDRETRLRTGDRHLRNDPQPRRAGAERRRRRRAGGTPEPARPGQDHPPHPQAAHRGRSRRRGCIRPVSIRVAPISRSPARSCSTRSSSASARRT